MNSEYRVEKSGKHENRQGRLPLPDVFMLSDYSGYEILYYADNVGKPVDYFSEEGKESVIASGAGTRVGLSCRRLLRLRAGLTGQFGLT